MKLKRDLTKVNSGPANPTLRFSGRSKALLAKRGGSCARGAQEGTLDPTNQPFAVYVKSLVSMG